MVFEVWGQVAVSHQKQQLDCTFGTERKEHGGDITLAPVQTKFS